MSTNTETAEARTAQSCGQYYISTDVDSWVTEKFPTAIRIGRPCPPFAFGEDVAAIHPSLQKAGAK